MGMRYASFAGDTTGAAADRSHMSLTTETDLGNKACDAPQPGEAYCMAIHKHMSRDDAKVHLAEEGIEQCALACP